MALTPRLSGQVAARAHHSGAARLLKRAAPFFAIAEVSGGPLLIASLIALVLVNSPWSGWYERIWDTDLRLSYGGEIIALPLAEWVNDALMPLFFLIIGTEVKREFSKGSLSTVQTAVLPVAGAIGGLVVPIGIYLAFNYGTATQHGWGVVAAMDTAFSLAIVAMFTTRLPAAVRAVLLAFAAIDDVFGLLVIAFAYTDTLQVSYLLLAAAGYVGILLLLRLGWVASVAYVLLGAAVWIGVLGSGVHPTIAGVAIGLLLPTSSRLSEQRFADRVQRPVDRLRRAQRVATTADDEATAERGREEAQSQLGYIHEMAAATDEPAERLVRILTPWVSYLILPLFALSNVRIHFSPELIGEALHAPLALGIVAGLVIGKPVGFFVATRAAAATGVARLPDGVTWRMIVGIGGVAGIGFTISLFIAELAFVGSAGTEIAALAILTASLVSGLFGYIMLWSAATREERTAPPPVTE
ncbi:Na+/H+ antiporter NhaA [Sphingomonas endophytica]|uniref:Na(+)/H(+) antiporter NhaA n=1 Tax=Sphingomonas endophytica TaxID=869719 RepID=A0ABR6N1X4_9SPHN|nr:Na+/H+ antiporter NhaA [Sphingomonas endophytica]MBB5724195.1 NhaA family Na+:H+ antiporter [Sphingomonas endophytica]